VSADSVVHARLCLALLCCIEAAEHQWGVRARRSDDTDVTGSGAAVPRDKGAARRRRPTLPDEGQDQRPLLRHPHDGTAAGLGTLLIKRKGHAVQGRSLVSWSSVRANLNCCCTVDSIYPTVFRPGSSPNNCGKCSRSNPASCSDLQPAALHIGARIACPCMFSSNQYPMLVSVS
jgi:hypothetical protein